MNITLSRYAHDVKARFTMGDFALGNTVTYSAMSNEFLIRISRGLIKLKKNLPIMRLGPPHLTQLNC